MPENASGRTDAAATSPRGTKGTSGAPGARGPSGTSKAREESEQRRSAATRRGSSRPPAAPAPDVPQPSMGDPMAFGPGAEDTLSSVIARYERKGFTGQFAAKPSAAVQCLGCNETSHAGEYTLHALHRLEGASDPGEMMACAALECPSCGGKGTITLAYGPAAPPNDGALLKAFSDHRDTSGIHPGI